MKPDLDEIRKSSPAPAPEQEYSLADLVAKITKDNLHAEIDTGPPVGKEIW